MTVSADCRQDLFSLWVEQLEPDLHLYCSLEGIGRGSEKDATVTFEPEAGAARPASSKVEGETLDDLLAGSDDDLI